MKREANNLKQQLFICCNTKQDGSGCGPKGAEALRLRLKDRVQALKDPSVKVTKSGCLGKCSEGIAAMLYPEGSLITEIGQNDEDALFSSLNN